MIWLKKFIDLDVHDTHTSTFESPTIRLYPKFLSICNERLNDPLAAIDYMKEIVDVLVRYDLIATIYKMTISFYYYHEKSKIECICDHIHSVIDQIKLKRHRWTKWLVQYGNIQE